MAKATILYIDRPRDTGWLRVLSVCVAIGIALGVWAASEDGAADVDAARPGERCLAAVPGADAGPLAAPLPVSGRRDPPRCPSSRTPSVPPRTSGG